MEPTTGKAKYYTLMEALKEQILSGTIKPGQKLPSENELTREYALSRHTVRKALAPVSYTHLTLPTICSV